MKSWYREPLLVGAAVLVGAACVLALSLTERAMADDTRDVSARSAPSMALPEIESPPAVPGELLARIVDRDLFHPERHRPSVPFRLPKERLAAVAAPAPPPPQPLRLLGTVVTRGQDAFVMVQLGSETPRVVRVGGTLGGFTLRKIEPGQAIFSSPNGDAVDLHVPKAAPQ